MAISGIGYNEERRTTSARASIIVIVSGIRNTFHAENVSTSSPAPYRFNAHFVADPAFILFSKLGSLDEVFRSEHFML
jgi:hypothetical protein